MRTRAPLDTSDGNVQQRCYDLYNLVEIAQLTDWITLVLSLPTENATARMRAWRALKASGAAVLRDGVYLLPSTAAHRATFATISGDVTAAGGATWVLDVTGADYAQLFDRSANYQQLADDIASRMGEIDQGDAVELSRLARKWRKALDAIRAIDFFPGPAQAQTAAMLDAFEAALRARLLPDEPLARPGAITRRDSADYVGRLWATREHPWVDRLASAWLIRRFIDPEARFVWLGSPADCPAHALGFDFDGAEFSHVGERVTFETLLASFGLEADPALGHIARMVHFLDVGGLPVPEAAGLQALLSGMRAVIDDNDRLLEAAGGAFDFFHAAFKDTP